MVVKPLGDIPFPGIQQNSAGAFRESDSAIAKRQCPLFGRKMDYRIWDKLKEMAWNKHHRNLGFLKLSLALVIAFPSIEISPWNKNIKPFIPEAWSCVFLTYFYFRCTLLSFKKRLRKRPWQPESWIRRKLSKVQASKSLSFGIYCHCSEHCDFSEGRSYPAEFLST